MDSPSSIKTEKPHAAEVRVDAALTTVADMGRPVDAEKDESAEVEKAKGTSFLRSISSPRCQPAAQVIAIDETRDDAPLVSQSTSTGRNSVGENSAHQPKEIQDSRPITMLSLKDFPSDEDGLQGPALVVYRQKNQKRPQGAGGEVLMSHSDALKYIFTHEGEEEEGVLMSHISTLKYLLEDCGLVTANLQDVGVKVSNHMPSLDEIRDTLNRLLEDNGINATDSQDVELKGYTPKPSLKELRIKSALIQRDIDMIKGAAAVNNLSTSAVNVIIDELRMKNESIKRDIDATEVAEAGDGSSRFKFALPSGIFSVARWMKNESIKRDIDATEVAEAGDGSSRFKLALSSGISSVAGCASAAPPELAQCKEPSMAPPLSWIFKEAQNKDGSSHEQQERARGEEDEILMSHTETVKYLLKDCGIAGINCGDLLNKDGSSQEKQERAQGEEEDEVLMSHADTLKYLLKDCGVGI